MVVHRLVKKKHANDPLSGAGGLLVGGRWHRKGLKIVYCAESLSLASLEVFVHFDTLSKAIALVSIEIEVPDSAVEDLPAASPPASASIDVGTAWLDSTRSLALRVPSVITSGEHNVLLNPAHPGIGRVRVVSSQDYRYDRRMWKA